MKAPSSKLYNYCDIFKDYRFVIAVANIMVPAHYRCQEPQLMAQGAMYYKWLEQFLVEQVSMVQSQLFPYVFSRQM